MSYIVAVMGYSDAGKDTVARAFQSVVPVMRNIKFSAPMKRMLEYVYYLTEYQLEDRMFRQTIVPGHPDYITWSDLMVRCFHHFPAIDSNMMVQNVYKDMREMLQARIPVVLTDTRNHSEVELIQLFSFNYPLYVVHVHRPGVKPKASDCHLNDNIDALDPYCKHRYLLLNDRTEAELVFQAINIIKSIHSPQLVKA